MENEGNKKKRKILIIMLAVIITILLVLLIILGHKLYVIRKIWKANTATYVGENYCLTTTTTGSDNVHKLYYKEGTSKQEIISADENYYLWQNKEQEKKLIVNEKEHFFVNIDDNYYTDDSKITLPNLLTISENIWEQYANFYKAGLVLDTEKYNGKEYYTVKNNLSKVWIDKETYRTIGEATSDAEAPTTFYNLELNCVTEEDIALPDLSTYTQRYNGPAQ